MSSHHDNHSSEVKEVSFTTPLILALVTVLCILALLSTCDRKEHGCEAKNEHGHEATHQQHSSDHVTPAGPAAEKEGEHAATATETGHSEEAHH